MTTTDAVAAKAIIKGITKFLGEPTGETQYLAAWSIGEFEVAVERGGREPHIWLSQRWRPTNQPFEGLIVKRYSSNMPRISNLEANAPTLYVGHAARRLSSVNDQISKAVECVRACAECAGIDTDQTGNE